jgi:hypothetical protein
VVAGTSIQAFRLCRRLGPSRGLGCRLLCGRVGSGFYRVCRVVRNLRGRCRCIYLVNRRRSWGEQKMNMGEVHCEERNHCAAFMD